jgi:NAD(P)-dependent dehydrogenase (short-subunit alcohol dehydrogenase family)
MTHYDISGKSILVTGAAGGIGSATTRALVARGAHVTLVDLAQDSVDEVAATLPAERVLALAADVTSTEQMTATVDAAVEHFGRLDVVFANAGIINDPPTTFAAADLVGLR